METTDSVTFNPKVSIIIPVYNGSNYLGEAIDSALSQTYKNIEVIVVNDGSDDGGKTEEIARSYGDKIRYFNKENGGVASALNLGVREMTGEYFSWLSHDDVYYPNKIEVQIDYLRNGKRDIVLYSDYEFIDDRSRTIKKVMIPPIELRHFRLELLAGDPVNGCTVLVPRKCFDRIGLFNEGLKTIQDYDMWFRLSKIYRFVHIPRTLVKSRIHPGQGSRRIPIFCRERTDFFIMAFGELQGGEIRAMTDAPLSIFYAKAALRMKVRGFTEVSESLLRLSMKYLPAVSAATRMQCMALYAFCRMLNKKFKPSYWTKRLKSRLMKKGLAHN